MTGYPDDLPDVERAKCLVDELVFGVSVVEQTDEGPRRLPPTEYVEVYDE